MRVAREGYDRAPQLDAALTNTVATTQAQTVRQEVLGGSDGSPEQRFQLFFAPVLAGSLQLEVDEGSGYQRWQEVDDFFASVPDDLHYTLNRATGVITFPDGEHGHLPMANPARPADSVLARTYRHGGGAAGNLPPNTITQLQSAVNGVERVTNHRAAEGGTDQETVDQAKLRAPQELKSRGRAVTSVDCAVQIQDACTQVWLARFKTRVPDSNW